MLTLNRREAKMGPTFSGRTEFHGEDEVPAMTLSVEFGVDEDELDVLLCKGAHDALYTTPAAGAVEPRFSTLRPLVIDQKYEGATVTLWAGLEPTCIKLGECTLKDISLEPATGGMTLCTVKVLSSASLEPSALSLLMSNMSRSLEVEILDAKVAKKGGDKQPQLPLETGVANAIRDILADEAP